MTPRGIALGEVLLGTAFVAGVVALAAAVPAPTVPEAFWPTSVVTWFAVLGGVIATLRWCYGWWRKTQAPTEKAESDWRARLEQRLSACEDGQRTAHETASAMREMKEALTSLKELVRETSHELRESRQEIARLQGAFAHWDGQTERRRPGERRQPHDEP